MSRNTVDTCSGGRRAPVPSSSPFRVLAERQGRRSGGDRVVHRQEILGDAPPIGAQWGRVELPEYQIGGDAEPGAGFDGRQVIVAPPAEHEIRILGGAAPSGGGGPSER